MALECWFRDDVRRILTALASAGAGRGAEYHQALCDVGLAFGVELAERRTWREVEYKTSAGAVICTVVEDEAVDAGLIR